VAGLEVVEEVEEEDAVVAEAEASKLKASGGMDVWQLPSQYQTLTGPEEAFTARVNGQCLGYPMEAHQACQNMDDTRDQAFWRHPIKSVSLCTVGIGIST
jgi:hypothetical protein